MKNYTLPLSWDAGKFALRYNLHSLRDFAIEADGTLTVYRDLPDDPPIFETPDTPKPDIKIRLDAVTTLPELIELLKELL